MTGAEHTPEQTGLGGPAPGPNASIYDIPADIDRTRGQLGATIEALSDKVNVVEKAREKARAAKPSLAIVAFVGGVTVIGLVWWRRRRR